MGSDANGKTRGNAIVDKGFAFALAVVSYANLLVQGKKFVIANQLIKCGTSIGANVREAQHAESKADFIHKMKMAPKEAEETEYWLLLCTHSHGFPSPESMVNDLLDIKKLLSRIISTSKRTI